MSKRWNMNRSCFLCVLLQIIAVTYAGKKTLVLVDNWSIRETHSVFFKSLRGESFGRDVSGVKNQTKYVFGNS